MLQSMLRHQAMQTAITMASWRGVLSLHRHFSSSTVSDQFIDYAIRSCKGKHEQALDVLRSGLSVASQPSLENARLHLALAEVNLDASNLSEAHTQASQAKASLSALPAGADQTVSQRLQSHCNTLLVKSLLMQGLDKDACTAAADAESEAKAAPEKTAAQSLLLAAAQTAAGRSQLASGRATAAAASLAASLNSTGASASGKEESALPLHRLGTWSLAQGDLAAAEGHFKAAAEGAAAARSIAAAQPAPVISELQWSELEAAALAGSAQVAIARQEWGPAEELLGKALKAAEGVSTEQHPRVAPVLLLLGKVYARTARIMFAEGLYREGAKIMKLDASGKVQAGLVHPSLAAMLAWQFHQLLSTLPNRDNEATAWAACSRQLWAKAGMEAAACNIEDVLGTSDILKGKGTAGTGMSVCLDLRRGFEVVPPAGS